MQHMAVQDRVVHGITRSVCQSGSSRTPSRRIGPTARASATVGRSGSWDTAGSDVAGTVRRNVPQAAAHHRQVGPR
jgi:hypothetical protein